MNVVPNRCMARTQTNIYKQCSNNKKNGKQFCGIHLKSKQVIRIDEGVPKNIMMQKRLRTKDKIYIIDYSDLKKNNFNYKKYYYSNIKYNIHYYALHDFKKKKTNFDTLKEFISKEYNTNVVYTTY